MPIYTRSKSRIVSNPEKDNDLPVRTMVTRSMARKHQQTQPSSQVTSTNYSDVIDKLTTMLNNILEKGQFYKSRNTDIIKLLDYVYNEPKFKSLLEKNSTFREAVKQKMFEFLFSPLASESIRFRSACILSKYNLQPFII